MDEMRNLTPEDVKPIYRKNYADAVCFDDLPAGLGCKFRIEQGG
jgi:lysozyme family protein